MARTKYVKGKDGKFAGSIGEGKTNVPTAATPRTNTADSNQTDPTSTVSDSYTKFQQLTDPQTDDEALENAQVLYHLLVSSSSDPKPEDEVAAFFRASEDLNRTQQGTLVRLLSLEAKCELADEEYLPNEVYAVLAETNYLHIMDKLGENHSCPDSVLYPYISRQTNETRRRWIHNYVVADEDIEPVYLSQLSHDRCADIRSAVASHANTDLDTLKRLARSRLTEVVAAVAANRNTPAELLDDIAMRHIRSSDLQVMRAVIENPNVNRVTLIQIAGHQRTWVRDEAQRRLEEGGWELRIVKEEYER